MAHVVTEACIKCRYTDCVNVCPVECFHEGPNFMCIDPLVCIDCGVCVGECPVDAIRPDIALSTHEQIYVKLNAELARRWPAVSESSGCLPEADEWRQRPGKLNLLIR